LHRGGRGAAAVEYGLLAVLVAAVIVGVASALGTDISGALQDVVTAF